MNEFEVLSSGFFLRKAPAGSLGLKTSFSLKASTPFPPLDEYAPAGPTTFLRGESDRLGLLFAPIFRQVS